MSNLIFNISWGRWHFQVTRWPWTPSISRNAPKFAGRGITLHCAFGHHFG